MGNRAERFELGSWVVVPARGLIRGNGTERHLTPQQMETLVCLARRAGEVVTKEELLDEVWKAAIVEEGALARCVSELRSALGDDARAPKYIQTVSGRGYRLITEPVAVAGLEGDAAEDRLDAVDRPSRRWILAALLVVLLALLGWSWRAGLRDTSGERLDSMAASGSAAGPVVAVLGFRNLSGDPASDWLSTAMPELLANELAVSDEVRIVPAQSVSRLTQELAIPEGETLAPETLGQIRAALGTDFVVQGSFLSVPGQPSREVRLDARFQDARTAEVVTTWTETVSDAEVLSSLSRAGLFLRQALGVEGSSGTGPAVAAYLPKDPTALRLYFQGVRSLRLFEATAARDYLSRSLALEPNQPFALLALSQAWAALGYDARAVEVAQRALDRSRGLPRENRLLIEASYFAVSSRWSEAIERYRALWLLAPDNLGYAVLLARAQNSAGLPEEALGTLEEIIAAEGGETDPRVFLTIAESAARTGDHERALEASRSAAERAEVLGSSLMLAKSRQAQAMALYALGKVGEASSALEEARSGFARAGDFASEAGAMGTEGEWLIEAGDYRLAHERLTSALAGYREVGDRRGEAEILVRVGQVLANRGDLDGAKGALEGAVSTFVELEDRFGQATALEALADALGSNGKPREAEPLLREAAQIFGSIGAHERAAVTRSVLGLSLIVTARCADAQIVLEDAERDLRSSGSRYQLARAWHRLAIATSCQGDLPSARLYAESALEMSQELDNPRLRGFAQVRLAMIDTAEGRFDEASNAALATLAIAREFGMSTLEVGALVRLSELSLARRDLENALEHGSRAVEQAEATQKFLAGAYDSVARVLLARGDVTKARALVELASEHDDGLSDVSLELALTSARLRMRSATSEEIRETIERIEETGRRQGHWVLEIDARMARAELEGYLGNTATARTILEEVAAEAAGKGWVVLAARARAALDELSSPAAARSG